MQVKIKLKSKENESKNNITSAIMIRGKSAMFRELFKSGERTEIYGSR